MAKKYFDNMPAVDAKALNTSLGIPVNIKHYGAVGDGVTDDTIAIQAAVDALPLNVASTGVLSPKGFANGGTIIIPRGRYKITGVINLNRGVRIVGEGRESTQILSFSAGGVFRYEIAGRYIPDEIVFENLSILQDATVTATSGAAIDVVEGDNPTVFLKVSNIWIEGTYIGVRIQSCIGSSIRDTLIASTESHGIMVNSNPTTNTSITFQNTYCYSSQTGSGFYIKDISYFDMTACASDSNAEYGYYIENAVSMMFNGGAELNELDQMYVKGGGTSFIQARLISGDGNHNGITLDGTAAITLSGDITSSAGTIGYGVYRTNIVSSLIITSLQTNVGYAGSNRINDTKYLLELNSGQTGFLGGLGKNWSFGVNGTYPSANTQLSVEGTGEDTTSIGFNVGVAHNFAGATNSQIITKFKTAANASLSVAVGIAQSILAAVKGTGSSIARLIGLYIAEQTEGSSANANVSINTLFPSVGSWNIYSHSEKVSYFRKGFRMGADDGVLWDVGSGSPEGVLTAPVGSFYSRTDGGSGTSFYVKESGTGNTGWVGK